MKKMSQVEIVFFNHKKRRGLSLQYEPYAFDLGIPRPVAKGNKTYTPDFYCLEEDTYYEVINNYSYYRTTKWKYDLLMKQRPNIKFKIVWPDGDEIKEL